MPATHVTARTFDLGVAKTIPYGAIPLVEVYTIPSGGLDSGSTIKFFRIPAGYTVYDVQAVTDGLGTSVTVSVGDSGSATRFINAQSAANAATINKATGTLPRRYDADDYIVATIGGATATQAKKLGLIVMLAKDVVA